MRIYWFIIFLVFLKHKIIANDNYNCIVNMHFINYSDTDYIDIVEENILLSIHFDTLKNNSLQLSYNVDNPIKYAVIFNGQPKDYIGINVLILHKGNYDAIFDVKNNTIQYKNSILNTQCQEEFKIVDSLRKKTALSLLMSLQKEEDTYKRNQLYKLWNEEENKITHYLYKFFFKDPSRYSALDFISSHTKPRKQYFFSKRKLVRLFKKINPNLQQYQLYKDCKIALKKYSKKFKSPPVVKTVKTNL